MKIFHLKKQPSRPDGKNVAKTYAIKYNKRYIKDLKKIPLRDREHLCDKILELSNNPRPPNCKKLKGPFQPPLYRIRIGNYRVVYILKDDLLIVLIVAIGKRKDIYKDFQ